MLFPQRAETIELTNSFLNHLISLVDRLLNFPGIIDRRVPGTFVGLKGSDICGCHQPQPAPRGTLGLKDFEEVGEEMFFKKMEINYLWSVRYEQQALVEGGGSVYCLSVSATANNNLLMQISTISAPKAAQKRVLFASTLIYI